ncbi:MAG TPA: M20/M25/M40 family metallo-hydrolase [Myxococcota bacterium]|jgi:acetylornithine deacetylase/succinyl-diaminopimelate desuccinylase-like protein
MSDWDLLLAKLAETPRENGTAALHQTARFLYDTLARTGLDVTRIEFTAQPFALRLAGVIALAGGLLYWRLMRAGRARAALAVAASVPLLLLAQLEWQLPVFGWIGAESQDHVLARRPALAPEQRLILAAHYDTKTDALDHVERAPVDWLALPVIPLMLVGALAAIRAGRAPGRSRRLARLGAFAAWSAAVYGVATFTALSAGAFIRERSPGALDDGGACAVLVRVAEALGERPPLARTEVEVLLLSAEEVGVQGSWAYAAQRFAAPPDLPTFVVNLEGIGASSDFAVLGRERFTLRSFAPDEGLVALLDERHRMLFGRPLARTPFGGATDARSFLAHGIPAATLVSFEPGRGLTRGLHSSLDARSRLDEAALDASVAFLLDLVAALDARNP